MSITSASHGSSPLSPEQPHLFGERKFVCGGKPIFYVLIFLGIIGIGAAGVGVAAYGTQAGLWSIGALSQVKQVYAIMLVVGGSGIGALFTPWGILGSVKTHIYQLKDSHSRDLRELREQLDALEAANRLREGSDSEARQQLRASSSEIEHLSGRVRQIEADNAALEERNAETGQQLRASRSEVDRLSDRVHEVETENAAARQQLEESRSEVERLSDRVREFEEQNRDLRQQLEAATSEAGRLLGRVQHIESEKAAAEERLEESRSEAGRLLGRVRQLEAENTGILERHEAIRQQFEEERRSLGTQVERLKGRIDEIEREKRALEAQLFPQDRIKILKQLMSRLVGCKMQNRHWKVKWLAFIAISRSEQRSSRKFYRNLR